jgi:MFS family permease
LVCYIVELHDSRHIIAGWAAAPPTAIAGGTVNDLFSDRDRAAAMAFYVAMPLIGVSKDIVFLYILQINLHAQFVVGPISGAFIAQNIGVKYVFIVMSALCGIAALICIPCLKETYAPVIRSRLATTCSDSEKVYQALPPKKESIWHILWLNLSRPVILLSHSFICFILSLYLAL